MMKAEAVVNPSKGGVIRMTPPFGEEVQLQKPLLKLFRLVYRVSLSHGIKTTQV